MPIKPNEREYRALAQPLIVPAVSEAKVFDTEYYVEGYATTFDTPYLLWEDYDGIKFYEVIARGALDGADTGDVIMQYDHSGPVYARRSNNTLLLRSDEHGLFVAADLSKSTRAKQLHEEINSRLITKMSWCFIVAEDAYNRDTHTRTITKVKKVYDVSAVSIPANDGTNITARDYVAGVNDIIARESRERQKEALQLKIKTIIGG